MSYGSHRALRRVHQRQASRLTAAAALFAAFAAVEPHTQRSKDANAAKSVAATVRRDAQMPRMRRRAWRPPSDATLNGGERSEERGGRRQTRRLKAANVAKSVAAAVRRNAQRRRSRRKAWRPSSNVMLQGGDRGEERGGCRQTRRSKVAIAAKSVAAALRRDAQRRRMRRKAWQPSSNVTLKGCERDEERGGRGQTRRSKAANMAKSSVAAIRRDARRRRTWRRAWRPPSDATLKGGDRGEERGGRRQTRRSKAVIAAKSVAAVVKRDAQRRRLWRRAWRPPSDATLKGGDHGDERGSCRQTRRSEATNAAKSVAAAVRRDA
ncbi:UNVERIFIED_CONTAM: hypothetical protein K2H54_032443 [Gekko kuhli]